MNVKSRIEILFEQLNNKEEKALISFITCGDPTLETTYNLVLNMEKNGCHIIELGIPYSDPLADGPIIQKSSKRALDGGTNIFKCFELVKSLRKVTNIPLVFLVYFNLVFNYGVDNFIQDCVNAGIDGIIIPDLPLEERCRLTDVIKEKPLNLIPMVAPTSKNRIKNIVKDAKGFVYCVSSTGVTGKRKHFNTNLTEFMEEIKANTNAPVAVGFGISSREMIEKLKPIADGFIVGSAIIEKVEEGLKNNNIEEQVGKFVNDLSQGLSQEI